MSEILIKGGTIITMDKESRIIKNSAFAIKGTLIEEIGKAVKHIL